MNARIQMLLEAKSGIIFPGASDNKLPNVSPGNQILFL